ncbi:hypothetical protein N9913_00005, partial [Porticoccaceae bacterium]|nr:hypothetical protein [Porticoccaceae bacterium]
PQGHYRNAVRINPDRITFLNKITNLSLRLGFFIGSPEGSIRTPVGQGEGRFALLANMPCVTRA